MKTPSYEEIGEILSEKPTLNTLRNYLLSWKENGMNQEACKEILSNFRSSTELDEETDDLLLEWLDIVVGFCPSHQKVW